MKSLIHLRIFIWLLVPVTIRVQAQQHHQPQKAAIRLVMQKQLQQWNDSGNLAGFMDGYWNNEELRFVTRKGVTYGWKSMLEGYQKSYGTREKMGHLDFEILSIDCIDKNNALVIGRWKVSKKEEHVEGSFSLWFKRIRGQWKIVVDHTS